MKKMKRTRISISLVLVLTMVIALAASTFAGETGKEEESQRIGVAPEELLQEYEIPDSDSYDFTNEESRQIVLQEAEDLPASFSLVDKGVVTPVKL